MIERISKIVEKGEVLTKPVNTFMLAAVLEEVLEPILKQNEELSARVAALEEQLGVKTKELERAKNGVRSAVVRFRSKHVGVNDKDLDVRDKTKINIFCDYMEKYGSERVNVGIARRTVSGLEVGMYARKVEKRFWNGYGQFWQDYSDWLNCRGVWENRKDSPASNSGIDITGLVMAAANKE